MVFAREGLEAASIRSWHFTVQILVEQKNMLGILEGRPFSHSNFLTLFEGKLLNYKLSWVKEDELSHAPFESTVG